mgnify:CR=1 FL=1
MTTVVYTQGVMASDSSCWEDDTHAHPVRKIWRVHKCLVGCAGLFADINAFVQWVKAGADEDDYPKLKSLSSIVVQPSGKVLAYEEAGPLPIEVQGAYCAIGSGAAVALGALHQGATAVQAVRAARAHDKGTKGRIVSVKL